MFVTRRTYQAAMRRLYDALNMVEKQAAELRDQIRTIARQRDALTQHQAHIVSVEAELAAARTNRATAEKDAAEAFQLATDLETALSACWIRNARGHFERHPMNKAPGQ